MRGVTAVIAGLLAFGLLDAAGLRAEPAPASASASGSAGAPADKKAENKGGPFGPALFDKKKPIEITSDRLDVDQSAKTALFEGKVDAIQGDIHLRSDRLMVYYDTIETPADGAANPASAAPTSASPPPAALPSAAPGSKAPASAALADAASAEPASGGKIRRMDVTGHVFVSSPTETASGETGVYEAETGKITLRGNVVLTRGANVIRGTKLVIDVDSGRSVIDANSSAGGGRVKGLFVPKKDQGEGAQKDGAKNTGSSTNTKTTAESATAQ